MERVISKHPVENIASIKAALLLWAQDHEEIIWLDSNEYDHKNYNSYESVLAVEAFTTIETTSQGAFDRLEEYQQTTKDWIFGYLSYDLKNDVESLRSHNDDTLGFKDLIFFQPKKIFILVNNILELHYLPMVDDEMQTDWEKISQLSKKNVPRKINKSPEQPLKIKLKIHKEAYKEKVRAMLHHIARGDIYEANLCQEFYANGVIEPYNTYKHLNEISTPPFATYLRFEDRYLLSASPERYIKKQGPKIISQPIKGTAQRGTGASDLMYSKTLAADPKERSENVMIVDLVRNDLSRIALKGSVQVEELCKVYPFKQVHQMISTVTCEVGVGISPVDVLRATFPMGSMTGAPKVRAMQIIEELEESKRGLYSGSVGYFTPDGNFDFNVIIRSILYNAETEYISYSVGGAITAGSDPDKEYEECLLKARAMREVLEN